MTIRTIAAVIVATLAPAACGGAAAATSAASEATVEQYASLVADHEGEWRESVENIHDSCADASAANACAAAYRTASERAEMLRTALSAAHDPDCHTDPQCDGYLGEVPAEIAVLVADTDTAGADYSVALRAWDATNCANPLDWHCGADEAGAMFSTLGALTRQFDAWKAHTG
jgi:hypothetical protein